MLTSTHNFTKSKQGYILINVSKRARGCNPKQKGNIMNSTTYYVTYRITENNNTTTSLSANGRSAHLGNGVYVTKVQVIEGYTTANKATFERIIKMSTENTVEVIDWVDTAVDFMVPA